MYGPQQKYALTRTCSKIIASTQHWESTQAAATRTRSQRSQRSDGSRELAPLSLSALPEAVLEHTLTFVDENDDGRCRAISKSWARLRRVWILPYPKIDRDQHGEVNAVIFSPDGYLLAVGANEHPPVKLYDVR